MYTIWIERIARVHTSYYAGVCCILQCRFTKHPFFLQVVYFMCLSALACMGAIGFFFALVKAAMLVSRDRVAGYEQVSVHYCCTTNAGPHRHTHLGNDIAFRE